MVDVYGETRKHLLGFLNKVLDGDATQNELENFVMIGYQTESFEDIRIKVVEIITSRSGAATVTKSDLSGGERASIQAFVAWLE